MNDVDRATNDDEMRTSCDDIPKKMNDGDDALTSCGGDGDGDAPKSRGSSCGNGRLNYCVGSSLINTPFTKYL